MNSINKLSIVVPIGKMAGRLENLERTLNSTKSNEIEWLLVHDHFENKTCIEIDELIQRCKPSGEVVRLETNHRGVGNARNTGLRAASGNWLCFVDSDDVADISKYLEMLNKAALNRMVFGVGGYIHVEIKRAEYKRIIDVKKSNAKTLKEIAKHPGLWRWIVRRDRIAETEFYDVPMGEDLLFIKDLNPDFNEIFFSQDVIYTYKVGDPEQATNNAASLKSISSSLRIAIQNDRQNGDLKYLSKRITFRIGISTLKRNPVSLFNLKLILESTINLKKYLFK
ncbi:glycosyltransferase [Candidatus Planktophila lacus]|uniref:glycosyltransferase family 2 protein n=1 Tax=Candidatus Planktophila lacus TaxID=1884913 RepID=UPI000BACBA76|nr:glycosyltransferase family A protein [Candidatus Planktophila lacus]ASY24520.1 glycosyltransferase [Candidatus Planktophila lacus]